MHFTVLGIPRSGTTALARALNLHPQVFCAMEYFLSEFDYSGNAALMRFSDPEYRKGHRSAELTREIYETKQRENLIYGNKNPRYYHFLNGILAQIPRAKHIGIYRPGGGFCASWNRRAQNPNDAWSHGMTGLIAVLELVAFSLRLAGFTGSRKAFRIYNYHELFFNDASHYEKLIDWLGAPPDGEASAGFRRTEFGKMKAVQSAHLTEREQELWSLARCATLDSVFSRAAVLSLSDISDDLTRYRAWWATAEKTLSAFLEAELSDAERTYLLKEEHNLGVAAPSWWSRRRRFWDWWR